MHLKSNAPTLLLCSWLLCGTHALSAPAAAAAASLSPTRIFTIPQRHAHAAMASPPPPLNKGYGIRPSAAVEQGGGFYVPGFEGTKLRVTAAAVLSAGLVLNRVLSPGEPASSQIVSEALGAFGCVLIFAQSAAQSKLQAEMEADELRAAFASRMSETQELDGSLTADATREARARWAATTLLKLTPARAVLWVGGDGLLLKFGRFPEADAAEPVGDGSALRAMLPAGSPSQCVELSERPPSPLPSNAASAALCRCGDGVIVLASERPAAFSAKHVRWLEQSCKQLELPTA